MTVQRIQCIMKVLVVAALFALASATVINQEMLSNVVIGKMSLVNVDVKMKEICIMKLLNHILQPTMYDDIREVAREYVLEDNSDKYLKADVFKSFIESFRMGMLPRGENFVSTNELHLHQAIKVFRILYFAKDFDYFIKTACWLRERINGGMFTYALIAAVFHRTDCVGITIPAPYEIFPNFFVDSHVIQKAQMMKMTKDVTDPAMLNYYDIQVKDKNVFVIDWRKGVRHSLSHHDKIHYFTEDVDLNTYMLYLHLNYPFWMTEDIYNLNKERRGEIQMYSYMQLLARMRLERLSHGMCDIKPLTFDVPLKQGYWPRIRLPTGVEMPVRSNNMMIVNEDNIKYKTMIEDAERYFHEGIFRGKIELRDGTTINLRKPEDVENLARLVFGGIDIYSHQNHHYTKLAGLFRKLLTYSLYNKEKYTYIPTAFDLYSTCLRDPVTWKVMKRMLHTFDMFKRTFPAYTRDEFDFPGVKVEQISTDKLVTFMDEYDMDITNSVYLDKTELQKKRSDYLYVARMHRLNHHPFKVSIDVVSDKAVDAVVRIFLGPKYDCMGRLINVNDKRMDMVEIDSFLYKLETGKNTIVRNSLEMHGVIEQRPWTRNLLSRDMDAAGSGVKTIENWWYKSRLGFPHRLLLPLGKVGGMPYQMFVIVTPVRTGLILPNIDVNVMKERHACRFSTCFDTMPLGFPFDRPIDMTHFFTNNMKFKDVLVYRKDMTKMGNTIKDFDTSDMIMKKDDLTYLDTDMLVHWSYKDVMLTSADNMNRM